MLYKEKFKRRVRSRLGRLINKHVDCWTHGPTTYIDTLAANRRFVDWLVKEIEKLERQADPRQTPTLNQFMRGQQPQKLKRWRCPMPMAQD